MPPSVIKNFKEVIESRDIIQRVHVEELVSERNTEAIDNSFSCLLGLGVSTSQIIH